VARTKNERVDADDGVVVTTTGSTSAAVATTSNDDHLVGAAIIGRPVARWTD
jgi:hypothetical protein